MNHKQINEQQHVDIASLKQEIHELRNIIALMPGHVYWKDRQAKYLGCNNQFAKLLKLNPQDIVNKNDYDFLEREQAIKIQKNDFQIMENGKEITFEEDAIDANGHLAVYLTRKIPLFDEKGSVNGLLGVSIDITERKNAEHREKIALIQATEAKIREQATEARLKLQTEIELRQAIMILSGSIAHDLRTPIAIVEMKARTLKNYLPTLIESYHQAKSADLPFKDVLPPSQRQCQLALELVGNMGTSLIEDARQMQDSIDITLKTLSQVLKKELKPENLVCCEIWRIIHNFLTRYPFVGEERKLVHNTTRNFQLMCNEILMFRVLTNLLKNSLEQIKKNQCGKIFISTDENDNFNILRFKDTAGGAPSEVVAHIFDGYHTTKKEGTGIGLAFCKITMRSFGGDITCHAVYGDYIEFVLAFPKLPTSSL